MLRRKQAEAPAHPRPERWELRQRRARDRHQRGVARGEMRDHALVSVSPERAALAAFAPVGGEHERQHDELAAAAEQSGYRLAPRRATEPVSLVDLAPGQRPPL